ncbi:MAG: phosphate ABC transporter ATP-binding protein PstB [Cyanobacteriota bacterium]|nr:phosphate ABC transporter ATP-binding protein PstB [Cyanobacteriota bacterium]
MKSSAKRPGTPETKLIPILEAQKVDVLYGSFVAVRQVNVVIPQYHVTAFIGPSGCGKSTLLRCFNRMNDLIPGASVRGSILFQNQDIYAEGIDSADVRRRIGLVFQKPNPFPKTIYENIAFGPRINGYQGDMDELVEKSLRQAALWDEVKDKLQQSGLSISGGQQQRLCIARTLAIEPEVVLMDEPCASLDPISTLRIEELIKELKQRYTIVIVTHNMQQAARVSDFTAFFNTEIDEQGVRFGSLVEFNRTEKIFNAPAQRETEEYVSGRFG